MSSSDDQDDKPVDNNSHDELAEARAAAEQATAQAKELAGEAFKKISLLEPAQLGYLGALVIVVVFTFVFDMASFKIFNNGAVTQTQAAAERILQARMNSQSGSVFTSSYAGKLMWLAALGGIGIVLWTTIMKVRAGWVPLAQAGLAIFTTLLMMLIFVVGFPDLSGLEASIISNARSSATLLGYWVPLIASGAASFASVQRIMKK